MDSEGLYERVAIITENREGSIPVNREVRKYSRVREQSKALEGGKEVGIFQELKENEYK